MAEAFFRTLHMLGILGLAAGVIIAILATRPQIGRDDVMGLSRIYLLNLIALLLTIGAGITLWLWVGKPAAFFSNNPLFHAKLGLFCLLIVVLLWPATFFWRVAASVQTVDEVTTVPAAMIRLQKAAIPLLLVLPILAYLMARGIGY
jgi:putative membrane protein